MKISATSGQRGPGKESGFDSGLAPVLPTRRYNELNKLISSYSNKIQAFHWGHIQLMKGVVIKWRPHARPVRSAEANRHAKGVLLFRSIPSITIDAKCSPDDASLCEISEFSNRGVKPCEPSAHNKFVSRNRCPRP